MIFARHQLANVQTSLRPYKQLPTVLAAALLMDFSIADRTVAAPRADANRAVVEAGTVAYSNRADPRFLLVTTRGKRPEWIFPKGQVKRGEDPAITAMRELAEEAGVRGRLVKSLGKVAAATGGKGDRAEYFLVEALSVSRAHEGRMVRWEPLSSALSLVSSRERRDLLREAARELGIKGQPR